MPSQAKITREMIVDAAFDIAREVGWENINARTVSARLNCSTQPVMYHFKTIGELKKAAYLKVDEYHAEYVMDVRSKEPMQDIGLNYIRFAVTEKNLFRFLFQTNEFSGKNIAEMLDSEEMQPIIEMLSQGAEVSIDQAKAIFRSLFMIVHGYASMFANNDIDYNEELVLEDLNSVFYGAICAAKGGN